MLISRLLRRVGIPQLLRSVRYIQCNLVAFHCVEIVNIVEFIYVLLEVDLKLD